MLRRAIKRWLGSAPSHLTLTVVGGKAEVGGHVEPEHWPVMIELLDRTLTMAHEHKISDGRDPRDPGQVQSGP